MMSFVRPISIKKVVLLYGFALVAILCSGQGLGTYADTWRLGQKVISPGVEPGIVFQFAGGSVVITHKEVRYGMNQSNSSVTISHPEISLYTNGCDIYSADDWVINGGANLSPGDVHSSYCNSGGYPVPDGALMVPLSDTLIGVYHSGLTFGDQSLDVHVEVLYETLVSLSGESPRVIRKNRPVIQERLSFQGVEAVRGKAEDWWLIYSSEADSSMYVVHLTEEGSESVVDHKVAPVRDVNETGGGQNCISPDGRFYAMYSPEDGVTIFPFNRETGELGAYVARRDSFDASGSFGGLAFSSNSQFLYASNLTHLYQLELDTNGHIVNQFLVDTFDGFSDPFPATFYKMQIAPDCKIYMIPNNGIRYMHVIEHPNRRGKDCDFRQHHIRLDFPNSITLPNFPVSAPGTPPMCDSLVVSVSDPTLADRAGVVVKAFPNPTGGELKIELKGVRSVDALTFELHDVTGKSYSLNSFLTEQNASSAVFALDLPNALASGIYNVVVYSGIELLAAERVVVAR